MCAVSLVSTLSVVMSNRVEAATVARPAQAARPTAAGQLRKAQSVSGFSILHAFSRTEGYIPSGALLQDLNGNIYGTTQRGGAGNAGVVYKAAADGTITQLHAFTGADGAVPQGLLNVLGNLDLVGPLYGVTSGGGSNGFGTVYQVTTTGTFTSLYSFSGATDGTTPTGRLIRFTDGNLYGTTQNGGPNGVGTVYKLAPNGSLTTLYAFTGAADGGNPAAGLSASISGSTINGNLFGVTTTGGAFNAGTIFSISPAGSFTTLYSFAPNTDGSTPLAELVPDDKGNLFGTTSTGGAGNAGTLFEVTTSGKFSLLYTFPTNPVTNLNPMGASPQARLSLFRNGKIYGTTVFGGAYGGGVVFQYTNGTYTDLHDFAGSDGSAPQSPLIATASGNLYGTTANGGPNGGGVLFVLPQ